MRQSVIRNDVFESIKKAVAEGLELIDKAKGESKHIGSYSNFPEMHYSESGLPQFSTMLNGPTEYSSIFGNETWDYVSPRKINSWRAFVSLAEKDKELSEYFCIKTANNIWENSIYIRIENLIDRYVHVTTSTEFDENLFLPIYTQWENAIFLDKLNFDLLIPIIAQKFSFESFQITDNKFIEKLPDNIQLARQPMYSYYSPVHPNIIGAATHAFALQGWSVDNPKHFLEPDGLLNNISTYSTITDIIEHLFAAFRAAVGARTGYCQILVKPLDWATYWKADLPDIKSVLLRAFPDDLENRRWAEPLLLLKESDCQNIPQIYEGIASHKQLSIAAQRLNSAYLRKTEDDSILDITIALEALLTSDSHSEITHRLAMRLAALAKISVSPPYSPTEIYECVKKIYDYRSHVIHGSTKVEKKRILSLKDKKDVPAVVMGLELLRFAIRALCQDATYLTPDELDRILLSI